MDWWLVGATLIAAFLGWQAIAYFMGNPKFWRLVARHPDEAITLFALEEGCLLEKSPSKEEKKDYDGPFFFVTTDGVRHKLYIRSEEIDQIQARIVVFLYAAEGRAPHLGYH